MHKSLIALVAAGAMIAADGAAMAQQVTGNPLSSIFACNNPGNRQGQGAVIGGLLGGVLGNQVAGDDEETLGTILGAAAGAAAGAYIGCRMGQGDQQRAQSALQTALAQGRSQTWSNAQSGASGRIDVVNSYNAGGGGYYGPAQPLSLSNIQWSQGVEQPREYLPSVGTYQATSTVNIRSGPSVRAGVLGSMRNGETFDGVVRVEGTDWVLASRNGMALGYISETYTRLLSEQATYQPTPQYNAGSNQTCRVFDQTFTPRNGQTQSQRHTACQTASGEWVITA